jgi:SAM-dependent methyltransferase
MPNIAWENSFVHLYGETAAVSKNISRLRRGRLFRYLKRADLVLDLFCGKCETARGLKRLGFDRVICGDFSVRLLKTAGAGHMMRVRLDALNVPIKEHSFPFVIIQGGLHHLQSTGQIIRCLNAIKEIIKPDGIVFISEPSNTVLLALWLFFINNTLLWKLFAYSRNWNDLHVQEKTTHENYLKNCGMVHEYIKNNWMILHYKKGLVTDLFLLKNRAEALKD